MVFQCVRCNADVHNSPILCVHCHDALWCSEKCREKDVAHHTKCCTDKCDVYLKTLTLQGKNVPMGLVRFACKICYDDYDKAWVILSDQGVMKSDNFVCSALSESEIIQMHIMTHEY